MGFYSTVETTIKIKPELIEQFNQYMQEAEILYSDINHTWEACDFRPYFCEVRANTDGYLVFRNNYGKWYCSSEFVNFLKIYVEEGWIRFVGEDGEGWGWEFKDGKVRQVWSTWQKGLWKPLTIRIYSSKESECNDEDI